MNLAAKCLLCFLCLAPSALACFQGGQTEQRKETMQGHLQQARQLSVLSREKPPGDTGRPPATSPARTLSEQYEAEALHHIFAGRAAPAVPLLVAAEKATPGRYSVAANLGTAYELNGQNQAALRWIREGIARNPGSHDGTEWVHVVILAAKVRRERAPEAPFTPLIPLPAKFEEKTVVTVLGTGYPVSEIKRAVHYQLRERMHFVKPRDPYVADLLFTLSVIDNQLYGPESAYEYVRLAEHYGHSDQAAIDAAKRDYLPSVLLHRLGTAAAYVFKALGIASLFFFALMAVIRSLNYFGWLNGLRRAAAQA